MSDSQLLSQDEIDALLMGDSGTPSDKDPKGERNEKLSTSVPFDPSNQPKIIRERLHALDIINERFARAFRMSLFSLLRRTADITVVGMKNQSFSDFTRSTPMPANLNLVAMKPLRGSSLFVFPPVLVYYVVDILYGGDGQFETKAEGREFTPAVQEIIKRLVSQAMDAYGNSWKSIYPVDLEYIRSEMQARFASITNSPNEIVITTTYRIEINNFSTDFYIAIPYSMIEPIKRTLNGPLSDSYPEEESIWNKKISNEIKASEIEMTAEFAKMKMTLGQLMALQENDVIPIDLPKFIEAKVDSVPVMVCEYGSRQNGAKAIRVKELINHVEDYFISSAK